MRNLSESKQNTLTVGIGIVVVTILHTTWEGSGLHLPLSIHTALELGGSKPDC